MWIRNSEVVVTLVAIAGIGYTVSALSPAAKNMSLYW